MHNVTWVHAASENWTARSWAITGPLVDGPGVACTRTVLDCTAEGQLRQLAEHGRPAAIFLDPVRPLEAPVVQCGAPGAAAGESAEGSLDYLIVFAGSMCPLWRPDNERMCSWNASVQARPSLITHARRYSDSGAAVSQS